LNDDDIISLYEVKLIFGDDWFDRENYKDENVEAFYIAVHQYIKHLQGNLKLDNNKILEAFVRETGEKVPFFIDSNLFKIEQYAGGGSVKKDKLQQARDYWKELEGQMSAKQKKFYNELLKRRQPSYERNFNDSEIAQYINGEIIEQFGVDLGITKYQISGVNWFKLGFKYIAYREAIEEPEFWEEMNEYEVGGETITKPRPTITPTETPVKPDKDNPYKPKVKPRPKADYLISNK
jgi:hypothetical protein